MSATQPDTVDAVRSGSHGDLSRSHVDRYRGNQPGALGSVSKAQDELDHRCLTEFCVENPELDELGAKLDEFNIFDAAGLTTQEIRHSRFLAYLLDPSGNHGLDDAFLKRVLQKARGRASGDQLRPSVLQIELMDLSDAEVSNESDRIDILVTSPTNQLAVIVENKIGADEQPGQLSHYIATVKARYDGWATLPIFLTPEGRYPTDEIYVALSYEHVADLIHRLVHERRSRLSEEIAMALTHFERLIRRYVMADSEIDELCRKIVKRHRRALEILRAYIGDPTKERYGVAYDCLLDAEFIPDKDSKPSGYWLPACWKPWAACAGTNEWSSQGWIVSTWAQSTKKGVFLIVEILPGEERIRQRLHEAARANPKLFQAGQKLGGKFCRIHRYQLASFAQGADMELEELREKIRTGLAEWRATHMGQIGTILSDATEEQASASPLEA